MFILKIESATHHSRVQNTCCESKTFLKRSPHAQAASSSPLPYSANVPRRPGCVRRREVHRQRRDGAPGEAPEGGGEAHAHPVRARGAAAHLGVGQVPLTRTRSVARRFRRVAAPSSLR